MQSPRSWRKTTQTLAPALRPSGPDGHYDIYPGFPVASDTIGVGYSKLVEQIADHPRIIIDGYVGVFWDDFRRELDEALSQMGIRATWINVEEALLPAADIDELVSPFLGGDDPLFGTRFTGQLRDFFNTQKLSFLHPDPNAVMTILYGCGAALTGWDGCLVYVDLPKNELQFRARAGSVCNLGIPEPANAKVMYKRFYFVDWIALNCHKADLLGEIDIIVDGQRPDEPTMMRGNDFRQSLSEMSRNYFRVRPWFEPGAWGGQWIKKHIPQLPKDVPNYAWSFELITPENGIIFQSEGHLLEVSFDFLMFHANDAVLGASAEQFGYEFPIRFDFLDTFDGGNLSVQCHPRPEYIREHFGETFTQDETYYILDCTPDAIVYLGFKENIDPHTFRAELERSAQDGSPVDIEQFVNIERAHKHDLFLIPNGTIHCSGKNCLVLEISATPYILTFKMYDWLRLDLDGQPRPLNIERAFANLNFERQGAQAKRLVSKPRLLEYGDTWKVVQLPTHDEHFYDIHRLEFQYEISQETGNSCHVLSLVEGGSITLETEHGYRQTFHYAETFVVPAAADRYRLINHDSRPVKVIKAFLKHAPKP